MLEGKKRRDRKAIRNIIHDIRELDPERSQIWKLEQAGQFPKRKRYGFRRVAWVAREIDAWLAAGIDARVAGQELGEAA